MSIPEPYDPSTTDPWLVCVTCGTQFPTADRGALRTCFICDDPRQFTPPTGQAFATTAELRARHRNVFHPWASDARMTNLVTEPKLGIGQRAVLIRTPAGTIMWDCVTLLDAETVTKIREEFGSLRAIVISHPHYYSAHAEWAAAFACPVYLSAEDAVWTAQRSPRQTFIPAGVTERAVLAADGADTGARAVKLGGHFPGSLVLLFDGRLLVADTLVTTPAGLGSWAADALGEPREGGTSKSLGRPAGMNTFAFMWSIPNFIPLSGDEVFRMWQVLKPYSFRSTHGAFLRTDIEDENIKARVLESMKIQTRYMGWVGQASWDGES